MPPHIDRRTLEVVARLYCEGRYVQALKMIAPSTSWEISQGKCTIIVNPREMAHNRVDYIQKIHYRFGPVLRDNRIEQLIRSQEREAETREKQSDEIGSGGI